MIDKHGDIEFYRDIKGKEYMIIHNSNIKPNPIYIKNGIITYRKIKQVNGYLIKINTNGIHGFALFKGPICLESDIWSLNEIIELAKEY